jgi:hypothetical protein
MVLVPVFQHRMLRAQQSLTPAVDGLIDPGGLLLVVSHLLQSEFPVLWVRTEVEKKVK